jgi:hypothetical protein
MNPGSFDSDGADCWVGSYYEANPERWAVSGDMVNRSGAAGSCLGGCRASPPRPKRERARAPCIAPSKN